MDITTPSPPAHAPEASLAMSADTASLPDAANLSKNQPSSHALTPPTSEDLNNKMDDASSDLSELDMDMDMDMNLNMSTNMNTNAKTNDQEEEEEEEEIVPDHYWDNGKIPVFKPTTNQFRDFKKFIDKIDKYGMKAGIVKVIAPQEWRDDQPALDELVKTIKIKNPITQEFMGTHGIYTQANIEKQRSYNLPEWKALTQELQNQPPAKRGERRRQEATTKTAVAKTRSTTRTNPSTQEPGEKRRPGRPRKNPLPAASVSKSHDQDAPSNDVSNGTNQVPPTPTSPVLKSTKTSEHPTPSKPKPKSRGRPAKGGQQKSVSSRRMNNITEKNDHVDEAAFQDFDYHMEHLDEFTPERCAELETQYWKSLTFSQPMYAADMPGSLFKDDCDVWNVAHLPNLLDVLGTKVPGVNTAYLYMGMWKATFAWHLEDVDLYSINYIHFGAPKQWYSISQEDARKFEKAMKTIWPNDSKACDQFLRHKTYLISPEILQKQFGIKVNRLVHYEGEFVITYPYGYHSGYNLGYNCAESVNFATEAWLDYGRIAKKCNCESDSVWVDVGEIERKLRGEPTPEYYEETDDDDDDDMDVEAPTDLPSPPASVAGKPKASRKRKRDPKDKDAGKKKKRIRILIRAPHKEPCVLCPNDVPNEPLLPTDNGQKAHRCCALYTPETWITSDDGVEKIVGVTSIDKARLDLKCNFCRSKRGACFQCASKKCTRAFHATCALAAGVQVDCGPVPTFGEDGTEYYEEGFDLRCRFHRPKRAKNLDVDLLESSRLINNFAKSLKPKDAIQAQYPGGDIFAGLVVENRPGEASVLIDILPSGDQVEVEWKWIVVLDPIDSQRPKPSSKAIPMPEGMNKKSVSIENRQDGVPILDTTFHQDMAYKWAEFRNLQTPPQGYSTGIIKNPEQIKINLDKIDQLYYYLPTKSTEAKSRFTDDIKSQVPVAKADFMERVKPSKPLKPVNPSPSYPASYGMQTHRPAQTERPYMYKPKLPIQPSMGYNIDQRALASQQQFMQQADRRASYSMGPTFQSPLPALRHQNSEPIRQASTTPLRPFPGDAYYSSRILPAAMPGEYSHFSEQVRRNSGTGRRPSFGMQSHQTQPYGTHMNAPRMQQSTSAKSPVLATGQNFASSPLQSQGPPASGPMSILSQEPSRRPSMGQYSSTGMQGTNQTPLTGGTRYPNGEWTPPSRIYQTIDSARGPVQSTYRAQPTYQTPQEFQQQIGMQARQPSIANRYGAYDRALRDMAQTHTAESPPQGPPTGPYGSTTTAGGATNGFNTQNNHQVSYPSPKAPTPSPLSDTQTPRLPSPSFQQFGNPQQTSWSNGNGPQHQSVQNGLPALRSLTQSGPFAASTIFNPLQQQQQQQQQQPPPQAQAPMQN